MLKVVKCEEEKRAQVVAFIRKAQPDFEPDLDVLARSILIIDMENIVGMVSYGKHDNMGIIRYFLYDACLTGTDLIVQLFFELYRQAYSEGVTRLVAGIPTASVKHLFELLGFTTFDHELPPTLKELLSEKSEVMTINLETSFS